MSSPGGPASSGKRVKFDSQLLLKYAFDYKVRDTTGVPNVITVRRVKVRKTGGAVLAHYYATVHLANDFSFEFHPGSQPKTFQNVDPDKKHVLYKTLVLCEPCCRRELESYIDGENGFNIAFQNCESILCKRKSVQTVLGSALLAVLLINILEFSSLNLLMIVFLLFMLYFVNNHMISEPRIEYCDHFATGDATASPPQVEEFGAEGGSRERRVEGSPPPAGRRPDGLADAAEGGHGRIGYGRPEVFHV